MRRAGPVPSCYGECGDTIKREESGEKQRDTPALYFLPRIWIHTNPSYTWLGWFRLLSTKSERGFRTSPHFTMRLLRLRVVKPLVQRHRSWRTNVHFLPFLVKEFKQKIKFKSSLLPPPIPLSQNNYSYQFGGHFTRPFKNVRTNIHVHQTQRVLLKQWGYSIPTFLKFAFFTH